MGMRVVVTGATGNLGTSVVRSLASRPEVQSVLGLARRLPDKRVSDEAVQRTTFARCDVSTDDLSRWFEGADAVVHLAWQIQPSRQPARLEKVNVGGSRRVFEGVAKAGVPHLVFASSVGAYSRGPKTRLVNETWPTDGTPSSLYARQKAQVEREADDATHQYGLTIARMRPALVFKSEAASEIRRLFFGRLLPRALYDAAHIPLVPKHDRLRFQAVHSYDVGDAFASAVVRRAEGAFNLAADPVIDGDVLAQVLEAKALRLPGWMMRSAAAVSYHLRLQPADPGWFDMAMNVPLMDSSRARLRLNWQPRYSATDALLELFAGIRDRAGGATAPLHAE